jgi:hypothetical protein
MKTNSILILILFFVSCKTDVKESVNDSITGGLEIKNSRYKLILTEKINQEPLYISELANDSTFVSVFVTPNSEKRQTFFFSDTLNKIKAVKYKLKGGKIISLKSKTLLENGWTYLKIDSLSLKEIKIKNVPYFYFSSSETNMGQAVVGQTVNFHLLNLFNLDDFELSYFGEPSFKCKECIDGEFEINNKLKAKPELLSVLTNFSKASKLIYQKTEKDNNLLDHINYETKWEKDNNQDNSFGAGHADIEDEIRTTYYKTNLFLLDCNETDNIVENNDFIFSSCFRSNLIGYDKKKKMYFPVIVERCANGCNKTFEFIENDSLKITYEFDESFTIALKNFKFDSRIGN